jgi:hypothetical protein
MLVRKYCLACRMLPEGPCGEGSGFGCCCPIVAQGICSMSFIKIRLGMGKRLELWDSNVHKNVRVAVPGTASAQRISQLRY